MEQPIMNKPRDLHFFWTLFKSTFLISMFTVGGGGIFIPKRQKGGGEKHDNGEA